MKLSRLRIAGFRGFNEERVIEFHDKLTLISAPNSHGKTSISEALEFLIFGQTSKVSQADSKDEYKDSYRNRHYPSEKPTVIEGIFADNGAEEPLYIKEVIEEKTKDAAIHETVQAHKEDRVYLDGSFQWQVNGEIQAAYAERGRYDELADERYTDSGAIFDIRAVTVIQNHMSLAA